MAMLAVMSGNSSAQEPVSLIYEADLLGNIQQALAGLQGFGVMALELIQNADDAGAATLSFDVTDRALFVRNSAAFSTCGLQNARCPWEKTGDPNGVQRSCNFHAISRMGSRNKVHVASQIGRFGIGFVSVYQITDRPVIRSAGIEMTLIPVEGSGATRLIPDVPGSEVELPWAAETSPTRTALNASPTPTNVVSLVADAIGDVLARGLYFLRHLQTVQLRLNGDLVRHISIERGGGIVTLTMQPGNRTERWKLITRDASDLAAERDIFGDFPTLAELGRSPDVTVAVPLHDDGVAGLLYAYLPTEQPSGLPLHINADFFPHPTRRMITLTGEQHERYWNELLLDTASKAIAENFVVLRDLLGAERLWALASSTFAMRDAPSFKSFWVDLQVVAKVTAAVRTIDDRWCTPDKAHLPDLPADQQLALAGIGIRLLHERLRSHWIVLSTLGATQLRLPAIVAAVEAAQNLIGFTAETPSLRIIWAAIDLVITQSRTRTDFNALMGRLKSVPFVLAIDDDPASLNELWSLEEGVRPEDVRRYLPGCPIAHADVRRLPALSEAMDVYRFDDLASDLAKALPDAAAATALIGPERGQARNFYGLLTSFAIVPATSKAGTILADVPLLRTATGFVTPSRGRLPGDFVDPIGHFELVDTSEMSDPMRRLARDVLSVDVLNFRDYVAEHLEDILGAGPTREQYVALLTEILDHRIELDADGVVKSLADITFVRTRDGSFVRPTDCYYWSASLEALLSADGEWWVDEGWMPAGRAASRFQDFLTSRLGMRTSASMNHLVNRIQKIAETSSIDDIASGTQPIVRHIFDRFPRLRPDERQTLERLKAIAWLPAALDGERVQGKRYPPANVYRAFRSQAFGSQVHVVDLPALRGGQSGGALIEFLNLLEMPEEPPTEKVVAHLEHCMAEDLPASDFIYAILQERLDKNEPGDMDRLSGTDFIYDADLKSYLRADQVFWNPTVFRGHWHAASQRMRTREALYRRLGVQDSPTAENYAALLRSIAVQQAISPEDAAVHERCLAWLADALDRDDPNARAALAEMRDEPALLNVEGELVFSDESAWLDSAVLAAPFNGALDGRLVTPPVVPRHVAAKLFHELQVVRLSEIARLGLSAQPLSVEDATATSRLRERIALLLWLAPDPVFRDRLHHVLRGMTVHIAEALLVHAEIVEYDPPVRSAPSASDAFYDQGSGILYVRGESGQDIDWTAAFSAVFAPFEQLTHGIDMPPVIMTAAFVTSLDSLVSAERALRSAHYSPPDEGYEDLPLTETVVDADEDSDDVEPEAEFAEPEADDIEGVGPTSGESGDTPEERHVDEEGVENGPHGEQESGSSGPNPILDGTPTASNGAATDGAPTGAAPGERSGSGGGGVPGPFKSKADDGAFGSGGEEAETRTDGVTGGSGGGGNGGWGSGAPSAIRRPGQTSAERRSRMLSYVNSIPRPKDGASTGSDGDDVSTLIDIAAIAAVMKYEARAGRTAFEQPHNNPGFDVASAQPDGAGRRLIEVKGLNGEWNERGVKLSHVQFATAQQHPGEYWIYVVEHARDLRSQRVSAIANPFSKVVEYWFDHGWRDATEEVATATDMNLEVGARVKHFAWGEGTIEKISRMGIATSLVINFDHEGRKMIPFNSNLEFVV